MPAILVAIPTLNAGEPLFRCLTALSAQTWRDFEVIVIDNGDAERIEELQPIPFRVLRPVRNIGFGAAINLAIQNSSAPWIATLNDDTEPEPDWLRNLVCPMQADSRVGMCASRIRLTGQGWLDSAGMLICSDGSSKQRGHLDAASAFPAAEDVLCPSGCAALYRRSMLDEIGGFDEDFFLYCEDTDLGLRAQWAGWRCVYSPEAIVSHRYSGTVGAFSALKARFVERNRLWVAIKNFPLSLLVWVPALSAVRYMLQAKAALTDRGAAAGFVRSGGSMGWAFRIIVRAHWDTLTRIRTLLHKRGECARKRKVGAAEFRRLLRRHSISIRKLAVS
jgi:GT2 family glycosyltransferase